MTDFTTLDYLLKGNSIQQKAYAVLDKYCLFDILQPFSPLLTGTIPININIESSDLDICCYCTDLQVFSNYLKEHFGNFKDFCVKALTINDEESVVSTFHIENFEIEIFGQNKPSAEQNAFKHLLVEASILEKEGEIFRQKIIALKKQGLKTEPAFAYLLNLEGNPYEALLNY